MLTLSVFFFLTIYAHIPNALVPNQGSNYIWNYTSISNNIQHKMFEILIEEH